MSPFVPDPTDDKHPRTRLELSKSLSEEFVDLYSVMTTVRILRSNKKSTQYQELTPEDDPEILVSVGDVP